MFIVVSRLQYRLIAVSRRIFQKFNCVEDLSENSDLCDSHVSRPHGIFWKPARCTVALPAEIGIASTFLVTARTELLGNDGSLPTGQACWFYTPGLRVQWSTSLWRSNAVDELLPSVLSTGVRQYMVQLSAILQACVFANTVIFETDLKMSFLLFGRFLISPRRLSANRDFGICSRG